MNRPQRFAHALLWPVLAIVMAGVIGLGLAARPPAAPPTLQSGDR